LNKDYFSIFDVIQQAFKMVEHVAKKKSVNLIAPTVSEEEYPLFLQVYGDKRRFL
jgi:hypothetical protein